MNEQRELLADEPLPAGLQLATGDFDYGLLSQALQIVVRVAEDKIRTLTRRSVENMAEVGTELISLRGILAGNFVAWLRSSFGWSESTAYRWMWLAEAWPKFSHREKFSDAAIQALSKPTVPDSAIQAANDLAAEGGFVDGQTAKELIEEARESEADAADAGQNEALADDDSESLDADDAGLDHAADPPAGDLLDDSDGIDATSDELDAIEEPPPDNEPNESALERAEWRIHELVNDVAATRRRFDSLVEVCKVALGINSLAPLQTYWREEFGPARKES